MLSRYLLSAISLAAAGIFGAAAAAAEPGGDEGLIAAAPETPAELREAPPIDYPAVRLLRGYLGDGPAAFNPADPKQLVVGIGFPGESRCAVKRSNDGGKTWGALVPLPHIDDSGFSYCSTSAPAVAYSADGSRLYAAYAYVKSLSFYNTFVVLASVSTDHGVTWSTPKTVLTTGDSGEEDGFVDLQLATQADGRWIYLAMNYDGLHGRFLYFSSSADRGSRWTPVRQIAAAFPDEGTNLHGIALAAGQGGTVLLAYGWSEILSDYRFAVQVARSADHGATFLYGSAAQRSAATDTGRLVLSQPDIGIGRLGTAHLVYNRGGEAILYKYSLPPYRTWSATPTRLDTGISAAELSAPRLAVGACGPASILHASWVQNGTGSGAILYARKVGQTGHGWSDPLAVGSSSARLGGNQIAGAGPKAFSVWAAFSGPVGNSTLFGSRVWSGVTCP